MNARTPHLPDLKRDLVDTAARIYQQPADHRGDETRGERASPRRPRERDRRARGGRRRRLTPVALGIATATVAAGVAFIAGAGSDPHADAAKGVATQDTVQQNFGVFRGAADTPPKELAPYRLHAGSTHRVSTLGAPDAWVGRKGNDQLCIISARASGYAGGCGEVERVIAEGLFTDNSSSVGGEATTDEVAALLPDGVTSVALTLWDGTRVDLPVSDNTLVAAIPARPRSARFVDENGIAHAIDFGDNAQD